MPHKQGKARDTVVTVQHAYNFACPYHVSLTWRGGVASRGSRWSGRNVVTGGGGGGADGGGDEEVLEEGMRAW